MNYLKYLLFCYAVIGLLVTGGLLFNRSNKANIFLAGFTFLLSFLQLNYLYASTRLIREFPQFSTMTLPFWTLFGPSLWFYIKFFRKGNLIAWRRRMLFHLIPFVLYLGFTIFLFTFSGEERLFYLWQNFNSVIMPINYGIAIHISIYAIALINTISKGSVHLSGEKKMYLNTIIGIYILTAVVESYLTVYAHSYQWFLFYFLFASSLLVFIAYILYFKPAILKQISEKYYGTGLTSEGKSRIAKKIMDFLETPDNYLVSELNLPMLSQALSEKRHHVSQTISEELNTTFKDLINKKKIEYAQKLLADEAYLHQKIFAIAIDSGFTNKSTFHRSFVKFSGCTPNEYRKKSLNL